MFCVYVSSLGLLGMEMHGMVSHTLLGLVDILNIDHVGRIFAILTRS